MKPFQIILLAVFMVLAVAAVITFALGGTSAKSTIATATVWGTLDENDFQKIISDINAKTPVVQINYEQYQASKIDQVLLNALAEGNGPDIVVFSDDKLIKYKSKIYPIPYTTISERDYIDTYIDAANIFLTKDGITAIPFVVDPIVMYWNRTMFNAAGLSLPPTKWTDLLDIAPKLIKKNSVGGIDQALVSMGEYRNVNNAKDILTTLFFQSNNPISSVRRDSDSVEYVIDQQNDFVGRATNAVDFYAGFSNPANTIYTWNRSEANSADAFSAGELALYFGKASEIAEIRAKNPNLNFDVAPMLQDENSPVRVVKGTLYSMALLKNSKNIASAFKALQYLTTAEAEKFWAPILNMAPVRRSLLASQPANPSQAVFYLGAIQSKTWLDPDAALSGPVFQEMIESVTTGKLRANEALSTLSSRLQNLYLNK